MEPAGLLPLLQVPTTCTFCEPEQIHQRPLYLLTIIFNIILPTSSPERSL
jgi:hypothetical protein